MGKAHRDHPHPPPVDAELTKRDKRTKSWSTTYSTTEAVKPTIAEIKSVSRRSNALPPRGNIMPPSPLKLPSSAQDVHTYTSLSLLPFVPQDITYQRAKRSVESLSTPGKSVRTYVFLARALSLSLSLYTLSLASTYDRVKKQQCDGRTEWDVHSFNFHDDRLS